MAQATDQHTPKTLDDAARFLIEERGYEKNPALCWEVLEQIWAGRITLRRHWKKYDRDGNPQEDGAAVCNRADFRSRDLDFDRHGHIRFVPEWGDARYTIVEPCDFSIIWPPPPAQTPDRQLQDEAGPDPFRTEAADHPSAAQSPQQQKEGRQVRRVKEALKEQYPPDGHPPVSMTLKAILKSLEPIFEARKWKPVSLDTLARAQGRRRD